MTVTIPSIELFVRFIQFIANGMTFSLTAVKHLNGLLHCTLCDMAGEPSHLEEKTSEDSSHITILENPCPPLFKEIIKS